MFTLCKSLFVATGTLAISLAMAPAATAATSSQWYMLAPGDSCQLSLPTIDTIVRPRANGYRNEGTAAKFVICGYGGSPYSGGINVMNVFLTSLDGASHSVSCTFVAGTNPTPGTLVYATKTINADASGTSFAYVVSSDFEFPDASFAPYNLSVTCNLPAQVAITHLEILQNVEIGS
jgi:hypothetical protein